jgi:transcriptional regulator with XRE-family HTH domain
LRLGVRLRHARLTKGLSLRQLAEEVGCSESFLSKLENDHVRPSLVMLHKLVSALESNMGALFSDTLHEADRVLILRPGDRPVIRLDPLRRGDGVALERLVPNARGALLQGNIHMVAPGGCSEGTIQHEGEEVGYILEGELDLEVDGVSYHLNGGDSFFFSSMLPHGYRNPGKTTARVVWINSPPTF